MGIAEIIVAIIFYNTYTTILSFLIFLVLYHISAKIFQCFWHQKQLRSPDDIQWLNEGFKYKHIDSFDFIRSLPINGPKSVTLTNRQARDLNCHLESYYTIRLPVTCTILSRRPLFNEYKHFFSNCYYTENNVTFYDYKPKERTISKREQKLFVGFAPLEGESVEVHVFDQNFYWWLLTVYTGISTFLFMLFRFIRWLCIRLLPVIYSGSISFLSFGSKLIIQAVKAGIYRLRFLISRAG